MTQFARLGGSATTVFSWEGTVIGFARQISVQSPTPVAQTTPIHPMNFQRPVELITPQAVTMGSMVVELYDLFGEKMWERLDGLGGDGVIDLADIFVKIAEKNAGDKPLSITKIIKAKGGRSPRGNMSEQYHNCVVSMVEDGETIEIGTMEVLKRMTINFTETTRSFST